MDNYIAQALRTKSDKFYGDRVPLLEFRHWLDQFTIVANHLDAIKKTLFYGKAYEGKEQTFSPSVNSVAKSLAAEIDGNGEPRHYAMESAFDILHSIIGKATESGELIEALLKVVEGGTFDKVNFVEEIGDGFWYDAIGLNAVGGTFTEAQQINIAKLRKRFPEKFTQQLAETRDLAAERESLETSPGLEEPPTLERLVFEALGAASACWEKLDGAGTFESSRCKGIGDNLVAQIRKGKYTDRT